MDDLPNFRLLGSSPQFRAASAHIQKIARVDATVLIEGETGTGKELAARAIHYQGERSGKPFIPVNCGALAETLLESELFGHERGAFTDARNASPGLVSEADGGTLFLDEIDSLTPKAQAAMLRFLQDHSYRRVGSGTTRFADVRIIAASNANLEKLAETRQFRRDLLYRLNVLKLRMPSLREREGDAIELARHFLIRLNHQYRPARKNFHADALAFVEQYAWPGNVRELENVIHREFLMSDTNEIRFTASGDASTDIGMEQGIVAFKTAKARAISDFERRYVRDVLEHTQGNISRGARIAGQDRSAFGKLARKHGLSEFVAAESRQILHQEHSAD